MPNSSESNYVVPSVYVDQTVLRSILRLPDIDKRQQTKSYLINNQEFNDCTSQSIDQELTEFTVYEGSRARGMEEVDIYCSTPDSGSEYGEDNTAVLKITLQPVANGYIINNSCFLSWQQWHTVIIPTISDRLLHCIVCAAYIELTSGEAHVATMNHLAALKAFPPLEKLDLSITRKIRNTYHCGVCNEVFDVKNGDGHFNGKMHEGNLLFSINRASDLLDNYGYTTNEKTETYHFKTHQMNSASDTASVGESVGSDCLNDNLHYVNWQNDQYDDFEDEYEMPVFTGLSYATMAKKPKAVTQNFLEIDFGNKKVKVRFDSWHMVISPKPNRFWCMVCKKFDLIRNKQDHCRETQHLDNLNRCRLVEAYRDYFIRQVDDKLYHCGHCNNLQLIHEMEDHIQKYHPRKAQTKIVDAKTVDSPTKNNENNKNYNNHNSPVKNNVKSAQISVNNNNDIEKPATPVKVVKSDVPVPIKSETNGMSHKMPDIFDNTVIFPFGYKITIPSLSYNIVCKRPNDFYCGLCDVICEEHEIASHVFDVRHLELLQRTPFIAPYSCNLIRAIRDMLHCAICNIPITASEIYNHIKENRQHLDSLTKALNLNKLPPIGVKIPHVPQTPEVAATNLQGPPLVQNAPNVARATNLKGAPLIQNATNIARAPEKASNVGHNVASNVGHNVPSPRKVAATSIATNVPNIVTAASGYNVVSASKFGAPNHGSNVISAPNVVITPPNVVITPNSPRKASIGVGPNLSIVPSTPKSRTIILSPSGDNQENTLKYTDNLVTESETEDINEEEDIDEYEEIDDDSAENDNDNTFDSQASEDATFDVEEYVYLKLKNTYIKISNTSYNTLVHVGNGSRYCFVCSNVVLNAELQKHVDSRLHLENMEKYRFLDKYEDHLLRQIYLMYHCAVCNVLITRKELKPHLEWPTHALQNENTCKNIKKIRKNDIKGGIKQIIVSTQKENIYLHEKEPLIKIKFNANVVTTENNEEKSVEEVSRKNKIIIFNDNVLKFPWEHWQGIAKVKNGYKCNLCQRDLKGTDIDVHCNSEWHKYSLDKPFEKQYAPALVRKINDSTLNCLICNTEVSNKPVLVAEHMNGKRHARAHDAILKDSSQARTYTDCHNDVLML